MLYRSLFFALAFLFTSPTYAQSNFLPGYIINQKGEKIEGYINYLNWDKNPEAINFKSEPNGRIEKYFANYIREFRVAGEKYLSEWVDTENSPIKVNSLEYHDRLNIEEKQVFLQVIFEGPKSLYYYKGGRYNTQNFFINENDEIVLLRHKIYLKKPVLNPRKTTRRDFVGQLANYLQDCSAMVTAFQNLEYSKPALEKIFMQYYNCGDTEPTFQKQVEKFKIRFGVQGGISLTTINFNTRLQGATFYVLDNQNFNNSVNPTVGIFLDIVFPRKLRAFSLKNELLFTKYQLYGVFDEVAHSGIHTIHSTELGFSYLKLNTLFNYRYPSEKFPLFFNAGISNGLSTGYNYSSERERFNQVNSGTEEGFKLDKIRTYEQSFVLGLGINLRKFSVEGRCELGNGMSLYPGLLSKTQRGYLLLGYSF